MDSGWHGRLRSLFAFSFPLLLGALFFVIFARYQDWQHRQVENARADEMLEQCRSTLTRIQSEFSLSAQIEKIFRQIIEQVNASEDSANPAALAEIAAIYRCSMPSELSENARVWVFQGSDNKFDVIDQPPFLSYKRAGMIRVFAALLNLRDNTSGTPSNRLSERFITGVFGENSAPEHLANNRAGKMTPIVFEGRPHYLFWQKIERNDTCIGGLIALFETKWVENNEFALIRLSENIYRESKGATIAAFTISPVIDVSERPLIASDVDEADVIQKALPALQQAQAQGRNFPMRQLQKSGDYWLYRDQIDSSSPYTAWLITPADTNADENKTSLAIPAFFAVALWTLFYAYRFYIRQFELGLAFRLLFLMTGTLPVLALLLLGLELVSQSETAEINARIQNSFDKLAAVDEKTRDLTNLAGLVLKDILSSEEIQNLVKSEQAAGNNRVFNEIAGLMRRHRLDLSYLLIFRPGRQADVFATNPSSLVQARYQVDYFALSCSALHRQLSKNLPGYRPILLTAAQKTIGKAFDSDNTRSILDIFLHSLDRTGVFEGNKSDQQIQYSSVLMQNGEIAAYLIASLNTAEIFLARIIEELRYIEKESEGLFFCLNRDIAGGQKIYPAHNQNFLNSGRGQEFRKFLESAATSKYRMQLYFDDVVYIYEPLAKAKHFYAGAVLPVDDIKRKSNLKTLLLFLLVAILSGTIYLLSASVTSLIIRPTGKLAEVFATIAQGNLDTSFKYDYNNELGMLARATDSMINGLKERRLLGRFVSKTFDSEVISHTSSESAREMYGVILFSDIRNFTTISESNPAESIAELLNSHLKEMVEIINQNGGEIEQFIGDTIVAFFPGEGAASCKNALEAARKMMIRHQNLSSERARQGRLTCQIGIGLEYGLVMAGILKSGSRSEFCVIGPARANAEHFESLSKSGRHTKIIVGDSLTSLLPGSDKVMTKHDERCSEMISLEQAA